MVLVSGEGGHQALERLTSTHSNGWIEEKSLRVGKARVVCLGMLG